MSNRRPKTTQVTITTNQINPTNSTQPSKNQAQKKTITIAKHINNIRKQQYHTINNKSIIIKNNISSKQNKTTQKTIKQLTTQTNPNKPK